jgi:hypothetical protein
MWHHRRRVFCIDADSEFSQLIAAYRGIAVRIPSARCRGQNIFSRPVGRHVNSPSKWLPSFRRRLRSMAISRRPSRFARRHPRDLLPRALPRTPSSWSFSRFRSHRRLRSRSKRKLLLRHPMRIRRSRPRLLPRRFPDRRPCPRRPRRQKRQRPPPIIPGRLSPRSNNGPLRSRGGGALHFLALSGSDGMDWLGGRWEDIDLWTPRSFFSRAERRVAFDEAGSRDGGSRRLSAGSGRRLRLDHDSSRRAVSLGEVATMTAQSQTTCTIVG